MKHRLSDAACMETCWRGVNGGCHGNMASTQYINVNMGDTEKTRITLLVRGVIKEAVGSEKNESVMWGDHKPSLKGKS